MKKVICPVCGGICHAFNQVKRYTTSRPKTLQGFELYMLAKELLKIHSIEEANNRIERFMHWIENHRDFLNEMTRDEYGDFRPTHERLLKAKCSILKLIRENTLFTYLRQDLLTEIDNIPSTNNMIEGGVNA